MRRPDPRPRPYPILAARTLLGGCLLALSALAAAQEPADFAGCFEGSIQTVDLEVQVTLTLGEQGLTGTIDIPAQGADDLPLEVSAPEGDRIEFSIRGVPGKPTFHGRLDPASHGIRGEFTQSGQEFGFELLPCDRTPIQEPKPEDRPPFALLADARSLELDYRLMGGAAGSVQVELDSQGALRSTGSLQIPGQMVESLLTGHRDPKTGKLLDFELEIQAAGKTQTASWDGKALNRSGRGKPLDWEGGPIFSSQHPALMDSLFALEEASDVEALILDNLTLKKLHIEPIKARTVGGERLAGRRVDLDGLGIDVWKSAERGIVGFEVPQQRFQAAETAIADQLFVDPVAAYPELSQPTLKTVKEEAVAIPQRDGVELVATISRPVGEGRHPAILVRTPYGRTSAALEGSWWASRGYVHIAQDVRGRGDSDGQWDPFMNERLDGFDTIEWIAAQPWCNGRVGMIGGSYLGFVQWQAAVEHPPALKCIVPQVSPPHPFYNIPWDNGLFLLSGNVWWSKIVQGKQTDLSSFKQIPGGTALATLPLTQVDDAVFGENVPFFDAWLERDEPADWPAATLEEVAEVEIPVLAISGIWDGDGIGTRLQWEARRRAGKTNQWLIFGPWEHAFNSNQKFSDVDYGEQSILELDSVYLRFFDTFLTGKEVGWDQTPKARVFLTGANRWLDLDDFNDSRFQRTEWYLSAPWPSNGLTSGGLLSPSPAADAPSRWLYNPARSTIDEEELGTDSESAKTVLEIEEPEQGVLLFKGPTFERPTCVGGSIEVELYVSTTAKDGELHTLIADEAPDGTLRILGLPANRRLAFDGTRITPLEPNTTQKLVLEPWWFTHEFEKSHRLVLVVSGEGFPGFARVLGLGEPDESATKMVSSANTLYHDPEHPSKLTFWMQAP